VTRPRPARIRLPGGPPARRSAQAGQGLVEYGFILVMAIVVCAVSLLFFGDQLSTLLSLIASAV
jgi:hypothetical protein